MRPPIFFFAATFIGFFFFFIGFLYIYPGMVSYLPTLRIASLCASVNVLPPRIDLRISVMCLAVWWALWRFSAACCRAVKVFGLRIMISVIFCQRISSACGTASTGYLDCVLLSGFSSSALRF
tara:strand:- start:2052 stop:2420 length:369 start_codon:yes stop_codon:yes gene_type:complete